MSQITFPFQYFRVCPKCLGSALQARWVEAQDVLNVTCTDCFHQWRTLPADRTGAKVTR